MIFPTIDDFATHTVILQTAIALSEQMSEADHALSPRKFMHRVDQCDRIINRRLREDAVAEVEDVAGAAGGLSENFGGAAADFGAVGEKHAGVEVALHGAVEADGAPGVVEANAPVDADDGAADGG